MELKKQFLLHKVYLPGRLLFMQNLSLVAYRKGVKRFRLRQDMHRWRYYNALEV